jgi:pyruvate/2-oxoacid:ferredoxin oxidoreductase alpha subunit
VTVTGSAHDDHGRLRKNDPETLRQLAHLDAKITARAPSLERVRLSGAERPRTLVVSYGISARTCREVVRGRDDVALAEVLSLFPVPREALREAL